jgi:hypothetical protein
MQEAQMEGSRALGIHLVKGNMRRLRFRMIIPAYPAFNIYSRIAKTTTALGPLMVATIVSRMKHWDVEVIDENNYRRFGPKEDTGRPDHNTLQAIRPADVVGLYGGPEQHNTETK